MPDIISCPQCQKKLRLKNDNQQARYRCPNCGHVGVRDEAANHPVSAVKQTAAAARVAQPIQKAMPQAIRQSASMPVAVEVQDDSMTVPPKRTPTLSLGRRQIVIFGSAGAFGLLLALLLAGWWVVGIGRGKVSRTSGDPGNNQAAVKPRVGNEQTSKSLDESPVNENFQNAVASDGTQLETTTSSSEASTPVLETPNVSSEKTSRPDVTNSLPRTLAAAPILPDRELQISGTMTSESVSQWLGIGQQSSYQQWKANLELKNTSAGTVKLGSDLMLIEISSTGSSYEGFAVFGRVPAIVGPESYGLEHNYEQAGRRWNEGGGRVTMSFSEGWHGESFGDVTPGKSWKLARDFPEHTWLRDPATVCVVLPELTAETSSGAERFRLLAYFTQTGNSNSWSLDQQRVIPVKPAELGNILRDPAATVVLKVLAVNWLAESFPTEAGTPLVEMASRLREGQLLFTCLLLLTNLKASGLESHALSLLESSGLPNGIRSLSAQYLGAVRHQPSTQPLVTASADTDSVVKRGAIRALGRLGSAEAVQALIAILNDSKRSTDHATAAGSLATTGDATAYRALQDAIRSGNKEAFKALAQAGPPELFAYFVSLADGVNNSEQRDQLAAGLKAAGKDSALPVLLQMLERAEPISNDNFYGDGLTRVLAEMDKPEATPTLNRLATAGNVRAAHVLADSKNMSVEVPLKTLATSGPDAVREVALKGLKTHWSTTSLEVFKACLRDKVPGVVVSAVEALDEGMNAEAVALLTPLLEHSSEEVRRAAASAIDDAQLGDQADKVAAVLLRSSDATVVTACSKALVAAGWRHPAAVAQLAKKLRGLKDASRYEFIALLRHLSNGAMGPKDRQEYWKDSESWYKKWVEWADRQ